MFSTSVRINRARPNASQPFIQSSIGRSTANPVHRGIFFTTISGILLVAGTVLTWLGFNNSALSGKSSMPGLLLIALSILLIPFVARQFILAKKARSSSNDIQPTENTVTDMVIDGEEEVGAVTVVMDTVEMESPAVPTSNQTSDAPPAYSEITQPANNAPSVLENIAPEDDHEPPPSYEESIQGPPPTNCANKSFETCLI